MITQTLRAGLGRSLVSPVVFTVAALLSIGSGGGVRSASAQPIIVAVPVLPGGGGSLTRVTAVNANGTAAAGRGDLADESDRALRWSLTGGSQNLGLLPGGVFNSYATAIDSTGTILAGYGDSGSSRAVRWTTTGGYQILPIPAGVSPSNFSTASGISQSGAIVVGSAGLSTGARAFLWNSASPGASTNLGVVSGQPSSGAAAVSGDGTTVVGSSGPFAFRWTSAGGMVSLGSLPGQVWAIGEAVNTNGSVITGRYNNGLGEFGYRWTAATGMVALPPTPNGCTALRPRAISGDGNLIIGQVVDNVAGFTSFVWTPALGTRLLSEHLQLRNVNITGWQFTDATAISADGLAMGGNAILNNSSAVGWVLRNLQCPSLNSVLGIFGGQGCVGGNVIFDINYGYPMNTMPVFRWWKDGVLLAPGLQPSGSTISNYNTNQMTITNLQVGDAGNYQVSISAQGACETFSAPLAFAGPATLSPNIDPVATAACVGQNPFFFAVPTAANIPPSSVQYRWQKLVTPPNVYADIFDGPTGNGSTYFGTGTSTFSFFNVQPGDATRYRCVFSILGCPATSNLVTPNAVLTVNANTNLLAQPSDTSQCEGNYSASFSVVATPINAAFTYQWQKKNPIFFNVYNNLSNGPTGNGGTYAGTQSATLTLNGVYPGDYEYYRCIVTGPCGGAITSNDAYLSPATGAQVLTGPSGGEGCPFGDAALTIGAIPQGSTYQWQRYVGPCILCWVDVFDGPTGNGGTMSGSQSPTLSISGLNLFDTFATYRCLVTSPCGGSAAASGEANFTILEDPAIQTNPIGGSVCINGTKQLAITLAPGNTGPVTYQWWRYVPDFPIFAGVPNGTLPSGAIAAGAQTPTLTISNFKPQDAGQYYCKATGTCGSTFSSVVTLTVCTADFNCDGSVTADDIFAFLDAWFAQNGSSGPGFTADFNADNLVSADDIFAFLDAWFAQNGVCGM